jgi:PAS domain S-box-containing protein
MTTVAENIEVLRSCIDAFNQEDVEHWLESFHPEVRFVPMPSYLTPPGTTYYGREGMNTWFEAVLAQKAGVRTQPKREFRDLGDRVLGNFSIFKDGDPVPLTLAALYAFREGMISRVESFETEVEALAAYDEQDQQFRLLFQHASDAIILNDYDGYLVDANLAACDLFGVGLAELRGRTIFELTAPERVGELEELWRAFRARGQLKGESEMVSSSGERYPVELTARANFAPGRHVVLFIARVETPGPNEPDRPKKPRLHVAARRVLDERGSAVGGEVVRQQQHPRLTARELEVLQLAADGRSTSEIADSLYLSSVTVKTHFQHIYRKLGVRDRTAAVAECLRRGLIK